MERPKPKIEDIIKLEEKLSNDVYGEVHRLFKTDEQFYELDFAELLNLPEEIEDTSIILPTGRDMVDAAVDHTDINNARVYTSRKGMKKIDDEAAEMFRKFCLGLIYRTNTESPISPCRVAAKNFWLYGVNWYKTLWDADMWPSKPSKKNGEDDDEYGERIIEWQGHNEFTVPLKISVPHPTWVKPDPDHPEPQYVIESCEKECFAIMGKYPKWQNPLGKDTTGKVKWIEYWDDTWKCYLADGEPVIKFGGGVVKHRYGFIPYVEVDSGLGNIDSKNSFKSRWVGMLRYIYDLLVSDSRNYSLGDYVLKSGALPWGYLTGENAKLVKDIDRRYGSFKPLPEGVEIKQMSPDVPPDALRVWLSITEDAIASHTAPRSVRGMPEQGVRSGADRRLMIAEAATRYAYSAQAFQYGTAKVLINCAKLFKYVIPGDLHLWCHSGVDSDDFDGIIKRDLLKEPFTPHVEFAPISEEDEYRRHDDLIRQLQVGLVTKKHARRQMSNIDPLAMAEEEEREQIAQSPSLLQARDQAIAAAWARANAQRQNAQNVKASRQMIGQQPTPQNPQQPMGGMTTGVPQRAPLGSAGDMQNQLRQQRSPVPINPNQGQTGGGRRYA